MNSYFNMASRKINIRGTLKTMLLGETLMLKETQVREVYLRAVAWRLKEEGYAFSVNRINNSYRVERIK